MIPFPGIRHAKRCPEMQGSPILGDPKIEAKSCIVAVGFSSKRSELSRVFAMDAIFQNLTDPQREAVAHVDGPLLILAGPGSGKTRVVTHRIANLLARGFRPGRSRP